MLDAGLGPRLYVEPIGQGDSDKPRHYRYSTFERADLVEALWRHHDVGRTVVVTFDYTSLALLEVRRRAHAPVAGHAPAAQPAGCSGDTELAALAAVVRGVHEAGAHVLARLPSCPGGAHRAVVGDHAAGRSGIRPQRCRIRQGTPPLRATLGSRRDRPRAPGSSCRRDPRGCRSPRR